MIFDHILAQTVSVTYTWYMPGNRKGFSPRWDDARLRLRAHARNCEERYFIGKPKPHKSDCTANGVS